MAQIVLRRRWKRAPVGRIVLDEQHPLAVGLALVVDWRRGAADVIRGPAPSTSYAGQVAATKGGEARNLTAEGHEFGFGPASTEWTLLSFAALGTTKSALLSQSNWTQQSQTYLLANTGAGYGPETGSFCFGSGVNAGDASLLKASSAIDADPRAYLGLHRADGTEEIWWDGAARGSRSKTVTLNQTDARVRIEGIYTYSGWYSGSNLHILDLVWSVGLLPELAQAATENPWQLFRRDPVKRYFGASSSTSQALAASGAATASGTAAATVQVALAGVGVSLASGTATLAGSKPLAASGASTASGSATPSATKPLSASGSSAASASAAVKLDIAVAGVGVALATGAASITGGSAGAIQAAGSATATGSAATAAQVKLSAIGLAVSSGSAAVSSGTAGDLSAAGSAQAGGSASPVTTITISAAGLAQAAGAAGLSAAVLLAGAGAARSAGNAVLAAQLAAMASGAAQAGGSATLSAGSAGGLDASGAAVATGAAALKLSVRLAGLGAAQASGTATLEGGTAGEIRAQGSAQAAGTATASADVVLTAAGFVRAMGVGAVVLQIPLAAFGAASATGAAVIYQPPSLLRLAARVRPVGSVVASVFHV